MNAPVANVIWLEAERFRDVGGWSHDAQFMDQMGSPYLLATGLGQPVADAVTHVELERSGTYRLWVRCKDWFPSHSPGQFQVLVDGRAAAVVFGQSRHAEWEWVDGGSFQLTAARIEVRLHDLTGWWGRCDALVLSSDAGFQPATGGDELARQREQYGGVSREETRSGPYDVVVAGGGLAGTAAAVAAARHGCRVALLQDRPVLGGNASTEIQVPVHGDETREPWDPEETGLIEEFERAGGGSWSANLEAIARGTDGLDLFLNVHATAVQTHAGGRIAAISATHTRTGERFRFEGRIFIDCTGDASIGCQAGADFRQGRESRAEFGESLAPAEADRHTMGSSLYTGLFRKHPYPMPFDTAPWAYRWRCPEDFETRPMEGLWSTGTRPAHFADLSRGRGRHPDRATAPVGCWYVELGGMQDTIADAESIRDDLFRVSIGVWGYVKNYHPEYRQQNAHLELVSLNHIAGKRESRRLLGDYILTQEDYRAHNFHADTVAYAGWTIDEHHPQGFFSPGPLAYHAYLRKVSIPYRCLYSRNVPNLMMAGRNISATHVAFGGTRVMRTCCTMGQAAGSAASIAIRKGIDPSELFPEYIQELQQMLLRDGAYLPGVPNTDDADLARSATGVIASTYAAGKNRSWVVTPVSTWGTIHPLDTTRAVMFRAWTERVNCVELFLRSQRSEPAELVLRLHRTAEMGDFFSASEMAVATATVPPGSADWVRFDLRSDLAPGDVYSLSLDPAAGLKWDLYPYHPTDTLRGYHGPGWGTLWGCYKFRLEPGGEPPLSESAYVFAPENLLNGFDRAVSGRPCSWAPDPRAEFPQWIELQFRRQIRFDTVCVTFQLAQLSPLEYTVSARQANSWSDLVHIKDNRDRRRAHRVERSAAEAVRLIIHARQPHAAAEITPVCELRLYDSIRNPLSGTIRAEVERSMHVGQGAPAEEWKSGRRHSECAPPGGARPAHQCGKPAARMR